MRLLQVDENGEFSLTDDLIENIPPYAILSHTWGKDHEEVGFKDLTIGPRQTKAGYKKLRFCAEQAGRDGLLHFWVDTCCIDKSNSVELHEAITSMFAWYQRAAKCYVYLSDVSTTKRKASDQSSECTWEPAFRVCRWFTRGWTLQELLAPAAVEFFSQERKRLGDKRTLERHIHEITRIPVSALRGTPLSEFGSKERMSWAESRQTKRREDKAYSLLGIFDVYMPLIYGEGQESAFNRLQEEIYKKSRPAHHHSDNPLDRLPYAIEAPFNSYHRQHELTCLPDTRVDLLQEIYDWADGQDERSIFWLNGLAGTGKSTIARAVARNYFDQKRLGASFFFSRGGGDVSHVGKFVSSIAVQLARSVPTLHQHICEAFTEHSDIASRFLRDQWHELVLRPLSKLDGNDGLSSYVLVVDALDECDDHTHIQIILQLLAEAPSLVKVRLRVFLTSRPEVPIRYGFFQIPDTAHQDFVLHSISPSIVDHDISIFLKYNLRLIGQERSMDAGWPGEEVIRCLIKLASGLFIWAATACRFIREGKRFAIKRLNIILKSSSDAFTAPDAHLNGIYTTVLKNSISPEYTDDEKEEAYHMLKQILGSIVILFSPLSVQSIGRLLGVTKEDVNQTLEDLHSILDVPQDQTWPLRLHHPSFRDFLVNNDRCKDPKLWVDRKQAHQKLTDSCIRLMSTCLKQDICGLNAPGVLVADVEGSRVERCVPPEVQYACLYWIQHLQKSGAELHDNDQVHQFLQQHFLHWLEALGWMRMIPEGIHAIASLESITLSSDCPNLYGFTHDMTRFVLYGQSAIERAPLQVYSSAIVFAPMMSIVKKQFADRVPEWLKRLPKVEKDWNALLQTLEGHSNSLKLSTSFREGKKLVFSKNGKLLVSSRDDTVRVWDAATGALRQTLQGHLGSVNAVAFSPDGKTLASCDNRRGNVYDFNNLGGGGGVGGTVRLWYTATGALRQTLEGHPYPVDAVLFSPDGKILASYDGGHHIHDSSIISERRDSTVKLWDAATGVLRQTLQGHLGSVNAVVFSPDGKILASCDGSYLASDSGGTVKLWDTATGALRQTLQGHLGSVNAVAFSPDGKMLASCDGKSDGFQSRGGTVKLWDAATGALRRTLDHPDRVKAVVFSPDGKILASCNSNSGVFVGVGHVDRHGMVKLWDAATGALLQTLEGHLDPVNAVAFSPNGKIVASGSEDGTVKLWDAATGTLRQRLEGHSGPVEAVVFSPDSKMLASRNLNCTVKLWNAATIALQQTLEGHSGPVEAVVFSPDGKMLASCNYSPDVIRGRGGTVKLWDAATGALRQTLQGHLGSVNAVAFSPDGKMLASCDGKSGGFQSRGGTVKLWDAATGALQQTLDHSDSVKAVVFSPDGKTLASCDDKTARLWDAATGALRQMLEGHSHRVEAVAFSPDGKMLASCDGSYLVTDGDGTVKLWDTATGALRQTLQGHLGPVHAVAFSPDGKILASCSNNGNTVRLWDTTNGALRQTLKGRYGAPTLSFSRDGALTQIDRGSHTTSLSAGDGLSQSNPLHGILVKEQWVRWGIKDVLWLPPEYRPRCSAVYGSILALGNSSGRLLILEFGF